MVTGGISCIWIYCVRQ